MIFSFCHEYNPLINCLHESNITDFLSNTVINHSPIILYMHERNVAESTKYFINETKLERSKPLY